MGINYEQLLAQWRADLARIAANIEDLRARIDTESRTLYASLSAQVAALESDLQMLDVEISTAGPDAHARLIAAQIDELRAKGDAAYSLLQAAVAVQLDPTDAEIRRLEAVAAIASDDARATLLARIDELKSARDAAHTGESTNDRTGQNSATTLH